MFVRRRGCVCDSCLAADPSAALGAGCTSAIPGKYFKPQAMKYIAGNNEVSVTRTIAQEREDRRKLLKVGTYVAAIRETENTSLLSERCYEISMVVQKPTKSNGNIKDYSGEKVHKDAYYIKVDDFECLPASNNKLFRRRTEVGRLGMICVCKPGDDMFYNCDIGAKNSSSNGYSFKIADKSHDNIQGLYQASRKLLSGVGN